MPEEATAETTGQGYGPDAGNGLSTTRAQNQATSEAHHLWLLQATRVREAALRLLLNRFAGDIEAPRELFGATKSSELELRFEYARKLTPDYLTESERLFDLISDSHPTKDGSSNRVTTAANEIEQALEEAPAQGPSKEGYT